MVQDPADLSTFTLRRRTPGSFILVPCPKVGRSLRCQGQLEAAAAVTLAGCPLVSHIQEQPLVIWYAWQETAGGVRIQLLDESPRTRSSAKGRIRYSHIVPDFLVRMVSGRQRLLEVKPSQRLDRKIVQRKLAVARAFAKTQGWTFHVVTQRELFAGPLLSNLRMLSRYRMLSADSALVDEIEQAVPIDGIPVNEVLSGPLTGIDRLTARIHLFHLLATERLSFDPRAAPLNDQTVLFPKGAITWDPFDSVWAASGSWTDGPFVSSVKLPMAATSPKTSSST
jgi:hypothetical protein